MEMVRRPKRSERLRKKTWPENFAKYAWASVIVAFLLPTCLNITLNAGNQRPDDMEIARFVPGMMYLLATVTGIGAGIAALCAMGKYGKKRIITPAITGIVLHVALFVFLLLAMLPALESARRAAEQQQQQQQPPPQNP